ncbi:transcription cofactor vestigial-like protein 4 [Hetaerina americana]|uniref:transcription cofactor vestigial-like protein 4 n=1 Tax=Hetaerina americana TaxID=62018 RepID=UPI003A7F2789
MRQPQPLPPPQQFLRPSVITCAPGRCPPSPPHTRVAQAGSGDDPDIDEHFRRSLGSDYAHLFASGGNRLWPPTTPPTDSSLTIKITGNSVDDHFAKALGETWKKLQEEQQQGEGGAAKKTSPHPSSPPKTSPSGTWPPVAAPMSPPAASGRECSTSRGGERRRSAD